MVLVSRAKLLSAVLILTLASGFIFIVYFDKFFEKPLFRIDSHAYNYTKQQASTIEIPRSSIQHGIQLSWFRTDPELRLTLSNVWKVQNITSNESTLDPLFTTWKNSKNPELKFRIYNNFKPSVCPTSLQRKVLEIGWFGEKYRPDIPLMVNKNLMTEKEFNRLKPYYMPYGYKTTPKYKRKFPFKDLMALHNRLPSEDSLFRFGNKTRPKCITCAVVGNGGILNGSKIGQEIDNYDFVFRTNNYVRGHEEDIGKKFTHWIMYDRSLRTTKIEDIPKEESITIMFVPCRYEDYVYLRNMLDGNLRSDGKNNFPKVRFKADQIRLLHPDFARYIKHIWLPSKKFRPSTGAISLLTALHSGCDRIGIYGMGVTNAYTVYYFDKKFSKASIYKAKSSASHDLAAEIKLMQKLQEDGIAYYYRRDARDLF